MIFALFLELFIFKNGSYVSLCVQHPYDFNAIRKRAVKNQKIRKAFNPLLS
jgi:hypothetical protein